MHIDRFKLHFGPYCTPSYKIGARVECLARGEVTIVGTSTGRIPWPIGKTKRAKSLVLFGDLANAVRMESSQAVQHWWGVKANTVWKWRKTLGVEYVNPGHLKLKQAYADTDWFRAAREKAFTKLSDPERCEKIAASKRGKSRPAYVVKAMRKRMLGKSPASETRQLMSMAHKQRGTRPPKAGPAWLPWEDELCRMPAATVVTETGRTLSAVYNRRHDLGLADADVEPKRRFVPRPVGWTQMRCPTQMSRR